jgi:hypothetical protein
MATPKTIDLYLTIGDDLIISNKDGSVKLRHLDFSNDASPGDTINWWPKNDSNTKMPVLDFQNISITCKDRKLFDDATPIKVGNNITGYTTKIKDVALSSDDGYEYNIIISFDPKIRVTAPPNEA